MKLPKNNTPLPEENRNFFQYLWSIKGTILFWAIVCAPTVSLAAAEAWEAWEARDTLTATQFEVGGERTTEGYGLSSLGPNAESYVDPADSELASRLSQLHNQLRIDIGAQRLECDDETTP